MGIIIQARTGSTRLPEKMISRFYGEMTLLGVILEKLKVIADEFSIPVIVATTDNHRDDRIERIAFDMNCLVFRGSENDVLDRFIKAADEYQIEKIIRVCGDNPFLISDEIRYLIQKFKDEDLDYLSFKVNGKPSILTHFGLWTEAVKKSALKKITELTKDKFYHEHVTNYLYSNEEFFKIDWILRNDDKFARSDVRLTIDTKEDFELVSGIYRNLREQGLSEDMNALFSYIDRHPDVKSIMKQNIEKNSK